MHGPNTATAWLSLTPEPERHLPSCSRSLIALRVEEGRPDGPRRRRLPGGPLDDGTVARDQQSQAREASSVCPVAALRVEP
jgi:4Fe-4S single cluster domain